MRRATGDEVLAWLAERGVSFFTVRDLVDSFGLDPRQATKLAGRLAKANKVRRLRRGTYAVTSPAVWGRPEAAFEGDWYAAAAKLAEPGPYYLAYYTAMELHAMLQHPLATVFVAVTSQRPDVVVAPVRFRFVTLSPERFFGAEEQSIRGSDPIMVANLERTFIDCVDRVDLCGGIEEVVRGFGRRNMDLDPDRLLLCVLRLNRPVVAKRLGFLLELVGHDDVQLLWELERVAGRVRHYLPLVAGDVTKDAQRTRRWELLVNAPIERLQAAARS